MVLVIIAAALLLVAAVHDLATRTIPNCVPAVLAIVGISLRAAHGGLLPELGLAAGLLLILGFLWSRGLLGGGDAKLLVATALLLPPAGFVAFLLAVAVAGGVLSVAYLALSFVVRRPAPGRRTGFFARVLKAEAWRVSRRGPLPYGAAIAAGALLFLLPALDR